MEYGDRIVGILSPSGPNDHPNYLESSGEWITRMAEINMSLHEYYSSIYHQTTVHIPEDRSATYLKKWIINLEVKQTSYNIKETNNTMNCANCNTTITDDNFKITWYQPGFESIDIGPYCPECFAKVKICSGCQHPKFPGDINHYGKGKWYCEECASDLEICGSCNREEKIYKTIDGTKYCHSCYSDKFFTCGCCDKDKFKEAEVTGDLVRAQYPKLFKKYLQICKDCFKIESKKHKKVPVGECEHCNTIVPKDSLNDGKYCQTCYDSFRSCDSCCKKHPMVRSFAISFEGGIRYDNLCLSCKGKSPRCEVCGNLHAKDFSARVRGSMKTYTICGLCKNNGVSECKTCLSLSADIRRGDCPECRAVYSDNKCNSCGRTKDFQGKCRVCREPEVYNYGTKPQLHFNYTEKDMKFGEDLYFGFENEMYFPGNKQTALKNIYKAYGPEVMLAKYDGSIPSEAFEVVSQPMTMRFFNKLNLAPLFGQGCKDSSRCGLHVHVSRKAFKGDIHILKVTKFIQENADFVDQIVGRSAGNYNSNFRDKMSKVVLDTKKTGRTPGRHNRVNLTDSTTIEFRMFATATNETMFRRRIEFLVSLIKWAENSGISQITIDGYKDYVYLGKKTYPNIFKYMKRYMSE